MSRRSENLASVFNASSREFIALFERISDTELQGYCPAEQCTAAALGSHVAGVHQMAANWIQMSASGQSLPHITMAEVDRANVARFALDAQRGKTLILEDLRRNSTVAARLVERLTDRKLDRTSYFSLFGGSVSTEDLVRNVLIADVQQHLPSIRNLSAADLLTA
jgi:hypothetical protein